MVQSIWSSFSVADYRLGHSLQIRDYRNFYIFPTMWRGQPLKLHAPNTWLDGTLGWGERGVVILCWALFVATPTPSRGNTQGQLLLEFWTVGFGFGDGALLVHWGALRIWWLMVGPVVQLQVHGLDWAASSPRAVSAAAVLVRLVRRVAGRPTTWNQKWRQNIYFFRIYHLQLELIQCVRHCEVNTHTYT